MQNVKLEHLTLQERRKEMTNKINEMYPQSQSLAHVSKLKATDLMLFLLQGSSQASLATVKYCFSILRGYSDTLPSCFVLCRSTMIHHLCPLLA